MMRPRRRIGHPQASGCFGNGQVPPAHQLQDFALALREGCEEPVQAMEALGAFHTLIGPHRGKTLRKGLDVAPCYLAHTFAPMGGQDVAGDAEEVMLCPGGVYLAPPAPEDLETLLHPVLAVGVRHTATPEEAAESSGVLFHQCYEFRFGKRGF